MRQYSGMFRGTAAGDWSEPLFEEGLRYAKEQRRIHGEDENYWAYRTPRGSECLTGYKANSIAVYAGT